MPFSCSTRLMTAVATSIALLPGFLAIASVTAGAWLTGSTPRLRCAGPVPNHAYCDGVPRRVGDRRDVVEIDRLAVACGDDQAAHVVAIGEEPAGLHRSRPVLAEDRTGLAHEVGGLQCSGKIAGGEAGGGQASGIEFDADHGLRVADRVDVAGVRHPLDLAFDGARDLSEFMAAERGIAAPQGERDDGHVVDALRLDQRLPDADARRAPVLIRIDRVVEPHDGIIAVNADLVLHREDREAGPRHRIDVFDPRDLPQDLLHRGGDEILDLFGARAGERNQDVGEGDVDLRLLLAGGHEHRERAHQQRRQGQQRRELVLQKEPRNRAR